MARRSEYTRIGSVGVDGGTLWIGDPCYIENGPPMLTDKDRKANSPWVRDGHKESWQGIEVSTCIGDGRFGVYRHKSGGVFVDFGELFTDEDGEPDSEPD